jgi:hypothetical protein
MPLLYILSMVVPFGRLGPRILFVAHAAYEVTDEVYVFICVLVVLTLWVTTVEKLPVIVVEMVVVEEA